MKIASIMQSFLGNDVINLARKRPALLGLVVLVVGGFSTYAVCYGIGFVCDWLTNEHGLSFARFVSQSPGINDYVFRPLGGLMVICTLWLAFVICTILYWIVLAISTSLGNWFLRKYCRNKV
ncbi:hypothetical protein [Pseudomonas sp. S1(2024)]|uniref:hypothetical protein n=1 Tax=Pseudomonas sp. S1(2024) TaxID=3390191 RepID=UPI00397DD22C